MALVFTLGTALRVIHSQNSGPSLALILHHLSLGECPILRALLHFYCLRSCTFGSQQSSCTTVISPLALRLYFPSILRLWFLPFPSHVQIQNQKVPRVISEPLDVFNWHEMGREQFFSWDEGACAAPKEIWNSTILVHWGNTNSKHKGSTTAYLADNWNDIPKEWRGDHPCYDPLKDIVLPSWKVPDPYPILEKFWARYTWLFIPNQYVMFSSEM